MYSLLEVKPTVAVCSTRMICSIPSRRCGSPLRPVKQPPLLSTSPFSPPFPVGDSPATPHIPTMADNTLKAAILIVSDTASQDPSTDRVGDTLTTVISAEGSNNWGEPVIKIVPDSVLDIQRSICDWTDGPNWVNLVIVSGGTGFATKDITPEVGLLPVLELRASLLMLDRPYRLSSNAMHLAWCASTSTLLCRLYDRY